jgi:hypothetical protein
MESGTYGIKNHQQIAKIAHLQVGFDDGGGKVDAREVQAYQIG